ncbi:hypothetical protein Tco_1490410 [Tanacetum coccineum]
MAALKYRDEHNRIGFLEKPKGSTDYHQTDQQDVCKYATEFSWRPYVIGGCHASSSSSYANKGLSTNLLGPDVTEDNFAVRMAAIIAERRRKFAAQRF